MIVMHDTRYVSDEMVRHGVVDVRPLVERDVLDGMAHAVLPVHEVVGGSLVWRTVDDDRTTWRRGTWHEMHVQLLLERRAEW